MGNKKNIDEVQKYLDLLSTAGFIREFWRKLREHDTNIGAYEAVERRHIEYFGKRKYKSYNSFQTVKKRYLTNPCPKNGSASERC